MGEDTQCFQGRVHILWILCTVWVAGVFCVSKVGRINEPQLAVAQLGASLGSAILANMERTLQTVLGHTCPCACS